MFRGSWLLIFIAFSCFSIATSPVVGSDRSAEGWSGPDGATFSLGALKYDGRRFDASSYVNAARDLVILDGGETIWLYGRQSENIAIIDMWRSDDITTAIHQGEFSFKKYLSEDGRQSLGHGLAVKRPINDRFWLVNRTEVHQFDLEIVSDVMSAERSSILDVSEYVSRAHGIYIDNSGNHMFLDDRGKQKVHQFFLESPFDVDSATYTASLDISDRHQRVRGIDFRPDGRKMFLLDSGTAEVQEFNISIPWDLRTAERHDVLDLTPILNSDPRGMAWTAAGTRLYINRYGVIYQMELDR